MDLHLNFVENNSHFSIAHKSNLIGAYTFTSINQIKHLILPVTFRSVNTMKYNEIRSLYPQRIPIFTDGLKQSSYTADVTASTDSDSDEEDN